MRVISQDGTIDAPYELSMIWIIEKYGYSVMSNMPNDVLVELGKYSSREKGLKAMEMLKAHYDLLSFMKLTAGTAKYESFIKKFTEDGFIKATTEYFQFPQDDEIEV